MQILILDYMETKMYPARVRTFMSATAQTDTFAQTQMRIVKNALVRLH